MNIWKPVSSLEDDLAVILSLFDQSHRMQAAGDRDQWESWVRRVGAANPLDVSGFREKVRRGRTQCLFSPEYLEDYVSGIELRAQQAGAA